MAKFIIAPHMRLHEWVARDKGYFRSGRGSTANSSDRLDLAPTAKLHDPRR